MYVEKPSNPTNSSSSEHSVKLNNKELAIVNYLKLQKFEPTTTPPIVDLISDVEIAGATQIKGGVAVVKMILEDLEKKGVVKRDSYGNWGLSARFHVKEHFDNKEFTSSVEVEPIPVEIVDETDKNELTDEEEKDKLRLERQVEKGFYISGKALAELRARRLYRNTHSSFESYCKDRFSFGRHAANRLIAAVQVVDNLVTIVTKNQPDKKMPPKIILPAHESQVRSLVGLEASQQYQVWNQAIKEAKNKTPTAKKVKEVAERMYGVSKKLVIAHHLKLQPRGLVEINTPHLVDLHQRYGRIYLVHKTTVEVWARNIDSMTMNLHKLKHSEVEPVPFDREPQLMSVRSRLEKLFKLSLDPLDREILMLLERPAAFTPREMECLEAIEARYSK